MISNSKITLTFLVLFLYASPVFALNFCPYGWYLLPGIGTGVFDKNVVAGFEISATFSKDCVWYGIYGDYHTNFNQISKSSVGLEIGAGPFGLDFGFLAYQKQDQAQYGFRVRPVFSLGYFAFYAGGGAYFDSGEGYADVGILFKFVICESKVFPYKIVGCFKPLY
jgi:hypothetical protein